MKDKKIVEVSKSYFDRFKEITKRPEMRVLPGNLAFSLILSITPILTLIALIASRFSISILGFVSDFKNIIPHDIYNMLEMFLTSKTPETGSVIIFLLAGFIAASNGAHSIIISSNTLYGVKDDNFLKRRIKSLFLTIVLILEFIFILVFLVFGNIIMKTILSFGLFDNIRDIIFNSFALLKWPILFLVTYVLLKLLYSLAPDTKVNSRTVTNGSLFTTIGWMLITAIYSYYANNLANYSIFYGSLANIIVLMVWIYIISYIFVVGVAINVSNKE